MANTNFLIWSGLRSAIPTHLKASDLNESGQGLLGFHCDKSYLNPELCKSKHFYQILVKRKAKFSRGCIKLKTDFCLDDSTIEKAFLIVKSIISEAFNRSFQSKILNDILYTNSRLAKIGTQSITLAPSVELKQKQFVYFMNVENLPFLERL